MNVLLLRNWDKNNDTHKKIKDRKGI